MTRVHVNRGVPQKGPALVTSNSRPSHQRAGRIAQALQNDAAVRTKQRLDSTIHTLAQRARPHTGIRRREMLEDRTWGRRKLQQSLVQPRNDIGAERRHAYRLYRLYARDVRSCRHPPRHFLELGRR
jgi:hypothetical protein